MTGTDDEQAPGTPAFSTPRMVELQTEIATTRAELAASVDELTTRLDPRTQAERVVTEAKSMLSAAHDPQADPQARKRARVVLGAAGAVAVLAVSGIIRKIVR